MLKKFSLIIGVFLMLFACSIERDPNSIAALGPDITQDCIEAGVSEQYPYGGCYIIFWNNGQETNRIFISNGAPGKDGINGIDGIDGVDGVSATVSIEVVPPSEEYPWGGYFLTIGVGEDTETIFISNGADGINGLDGIDGQDGASVSITTEQVEGGTIITITQGDTVTEVFVQDGQDGADGLDGLDGTSSTISIEQTEGGYWLHITTGGETTTVFVSNGIDGTDGQNGLDGLDGIDGIDGQDGVSSTIRTEYVEPSEEHPYGGYYMYITVDGETTTIFISNGADGTNGLDGQDGADGLNSLFAINTTEACEAGGIEITMGFDVNGNGVLDSDEIQYTEVLCNGVDGIDGVDGEGGEEGTIVICHEMSGQQNSGTYDEEWDDYDFIELTMTFSDYTYHKLVVHGGQSTQNDNWSSCDPNDGTILEVTGGIPE